MPEDMRSCRRWVVWEALDLTNHWRCLKIGEHAAGAAWQACALLLQACRVQRRITSAGLLQMSMAMSVFWAGKWPSRGALPMPRASTARTLTGPSPSPTAPAHDRTMNGEENTGRRNFSHTVCDPPLIYDVYLEFPSLCSDYGFKLSEDLSLQVCVPDPEFMGDLYAPPVPCPIGTTYRRSKG